MTCADVRSRLAEHALGTLSADEAELVERHLAWCAGCRKESADLHDGAAVLGRSVPAVEPSPRLEERVVDAVVPRRRRSGTMVALRRLGAVALAAAIVASLSLGFAFAERQRAGNVVKSTRTKVSTLNGRISQLVKDLGQNPAEARLLPTPGNRGYGTAVIVSVPARDDIILVDVYPPTPNTGPYTVRLQTRSGRVFTAGTLKATTSGDLVFFDSSGLNLSTVQFVSVLNRRALPVMSGAVRPYAATPAP